jgi:hypothetical protein
MRERAISTVTAIFARVGHVCSASALAAVLAASTPLAAQTIGYSPTGQPERVLPQARDYVVSRYRSARFGMTCPCRKPNRADN